MLVSTTSTTQLVTTTSVGAYFPALTGIRACAAYLVFCYHFNPCPPGSWPWMVLNEGHVGVSIFFVLSGFLIYSRYAGRLWMSRQWVGHYVRNRVARIYPLYFLVTSLTFLLVWLDPSYDIWDHWRLFTSADKVRAILLNYTLLRGFFPDFLWTGIIPGWTLTVEETFYVVAPGLLLGLVRARRPYVLLVAYAIGLVGLGCLFVRLLPASFGFLVSYKFMLNYTFFGRCIEFFAGIALGLFLKQPPRHTPPLFTWLGLGWIFACLVGLAGGHGSLPAELGTSSRLAIALLLPVGITLFFYGLVQERTWVQRLLATRVFDLLGRSSYAFYLLHMGVVTVLLDRYVSRSVGVHFGVLIGLATLLFSFVEEPLRKKISRVR